jgi:hypothetical protein
MTTQTTDRLTLNEAQRKLIRTAMVQVGHAQSNVSEAMHLEGLVDPEARQTWDELFMAYKRLWNILHDGRAFTTTPPHS